MTNQFTDEQVVAKALRDLPDASPGDRRDPAVVVAEQAVEALRAVGRLAAGVAPQAPSGDDELDDCPACDTPLARCNRGDVCCEDCNHGECWPPVDPIQGADHAQ